MDHIIAGNVSGKLVVNISKCDNGYIVLLVEPPKHPKRVRPKNIEAEIDKVLDGIVALNKHMKKAHESEGENWRGSRDDEGAERQKLREAFLRLNPEMFEPPCEPRIEQKVFGSKKDLFTFLTENL
jgi:hypothetical protein